MPLKPTDVTLVDYLHKTAQHHVLQSLMTAASAQGFLTDLQGDLFTDQIKNLLDVGVPVVCTTKKGCVVVIGYDDDDIYFDYPNVHDKRAGYIQSTDFDQSRVQCIYKGKFYQRLGIPLIKDDHQKIAMSMAEKERLGLVPLDFTDYGDPTKLEPGQLLDYVIQFHEAHRAGPHYDLRFGNPELGLLSWATKKELPGPGEKITVFQQPVHDYHYIDFQGTLTGYGAGRVRRKVKDKIRITKITPNSIHFEMQKPKGQRWVLVKPQTFGPRQWLLIRKGEPDAHGGDQTGD